MSQSLIIAHQCAVDTLEKLEDEEVKQQTPDNGGPPPNITGARSATIQALRLLKGNRAYELSRIFGDQEFQPPAALTTVAEQRASIWVNDLIFDKGLLPFSFRRHTWGDGASPSSVAQHPDYLLEKWTDQRGHFNEMRSECVDNETADRSLEGGDSTAQRANAITSPAISSSEISTSAIPLPMIA